MAALTNFNQGKGLKQSSSDSDGRAWITATGRGEGCQRCYSQIDLRRIIGNDGRVVTLCDDCRGVYGDGGGSR